MCTFVHQEGDHIKKTKHWAMQICTVTPDMFVTQRKCYTQCSSIKQKYTVSIKHLDWL